VSVRLSADTTWIGEALRKANLFAGWSDSVLVTMTATAELWRYNKGARVLELGEPSRGLWLVVSGSLSTFRSRPSGRTMLLGIMWPGDVIGLLSTVDGYPMPESIETRGDSLLLLVPQAAMEPALANIGCLRSLSRALAFRSRVSFESLYLRTLDSLPCQIAKMLAYIPRRSSLTMTLGPPGSDAWIDPAPVAVSQSEIAAMLGISRQTVNRVMSDFQRRKIIARDEDTVRVIDFKALLAVMEEDEVLPPEWRAEILSWDEAFSGRAK
jgi:CRP/FNR family transcriptional regulator, cyclic AMP receptor protein